MYKHGKQNKTKLVESIFLKRFSNSDFGGGRSFGGLGSSHG